MKARLETGNSQPQTLTKVCRGCFEVHIPLNTALCDKCEHIHKLQEFANAAAGLGLADDFGNKVMLSAVIESAKLLRCEP